MYYFIYTTYDSHNLANLHRTDKASNYYENIYNYICNYACSKF